MPLDTAEGGFSLLELAIVLAVMGILGGLAAPIFLAQRHIQKEQVSMWHQEHVMYALGRFLRHNGYLPCPADPKALNPQKWGSAISGLAACMYRKDGPDNRSKAQGIVPFKTLGIAESFAKDGYNHYFTYVVHGTLTELEGYSLPLDAPRNNDRSYCKITLGESSLRNPGGVHNIQLRQGDPTQEGIPVYSLTDDPKEKENVVAVVLISHGASGEGSFSKGGDRKPVTRMNLCKKQNADQTLQFCLSPPKNERVGFDDVVWYTTRYDLAHYYGQYVCPPQVQESGHKPATINLPQKDYLFYPPTQTRN